MKNMKTFLNWLKTLSSQQESSLTRRMRAKYPEVYWTAQPNLYASIWMKKDFFRMDIINFMAKYLDEMEQHGISQQRRDVIESIVYPMYKEITGRNYDANLFVAFGIEKPAS